MTKAKHACKNGFDGKKVAVSVAVTTMLAVSVSAPVFAETPETAPEVPEQPEDNEQQQDEVAAPSTEIESFTPTETTEKEDGSTETTGEVNMTVGEDEETGEPIVESDGGLTVTETPGETDTEESEPQTTTTTETTTTTTEDNTTTTTTETTTTTTETSETTIEGEVSDSTTSELDEEEQEEQGSELQDALDGKNLSDLKENEEVGGFTVTGTSTSDENGENEGETKTTMTVTFEKTVEGEASEAPLDAKELGVILGAELTENTDEDGNVYYTYTDKDGASVTVRVTADNSTESTKTTYTIVATQTTTTLAASPETDEVEIEEDGVTIYDESNAETAEWAESLWNSIDILNEDGTKTVTKDGTTYTVKREELGPDELKGLTNKEIAALLPQEGYEYDADTDKIYKTTDENGNPVRYELTVKDDQDELIRATVKFTVTTHGTQTDMGGTEEEQDAAKDVATKNAVIDAVLNAAKSLFKIF